MKIFVSYSRKYGKIFADHIHEYFTALGEDVFTDTKNIRAGFNWNKELNDSILSSDIFVIICTPHSLRSPEVQKEVEIAKNADKRIIPCVFTEVVDIIDLKWNLNDYQGVKFVDEQQLGWRLYKIIKLETDGRVKEEPTDRVEPEIVDTSSSRKSPSIPFQSAEWFIERGEKFENLEDYDNAIKMYDKAIEKESDNFSIYLKKSLLLGKILNYEKALQVLDDAIIIQPDHSDVWYYKGFFLEKLGKDEAALKVLERDLRIDPKDIITRK
ncbi:MAG TPA: toll/interleukin-1 receptor domain-containing protein, partial [Nitrososphaeraceae archaeon]|nr:toll/interleukin-1 receptor domain-containing protein [Nitrososphaeraceae archaeon]